MTVQRTGTIGLPASARHRLGPLLQRIGPAAALLAGSIGLTTFAATRAVPIAVPWPVRIAICGVGALGLWLGLVAALGERDLSLQEGSSHPLRRLSSSLAHGAQRTYLGALPLAALPFIRALYPSREAWLAPALFAAAAFCLCVAELWGRPAAAGHTSSGWPGLARSEPAPWHDAARSAMARFGGWELGSLLFCLCATGWFFVVASHTRGNADNDSAYYFGVARHIVRTGRFEEPLVWHFLAPPASALHAPFDYWQGLTTLVLLPTMALFGPTHQVAMLTMAAISGAGLVLFWYLVAIAAPLRHRIAQAIGIVAFAASPALGNFRSDTETVPVFHVVLLLALLAFAKGRVVLAACAAFCLYLTRGDGIVLCGLLWAACFLSLRTEPRVRRRVLELAGTIALLLAAHVAWCLTLYGTPLPPGARVGATVANYFDLYTWGTVPERIPWVPRLRDIPNRVWLAWSTLRTIPFLPEQAIFGALTLAMGWRGSPWRLSGLCWLLLFVGSGLVVFAAGSMFAPGRTLFTMAPLALLVVAAASDRLFAYFTLWQQQAPRPRALQLLLMFATLALLCFPLSQLRPHGVRPTGYTALQESMRRLAPDLQGGVLASMHPFFFIGVTDSPAIMIPDANATAIEQVLRRYRVRWLALTSYDACFGAAGAICNTIREGNATQLGKLRVVRTRSEGDLTLYRVDDTSENPASKARRVKKRRELPESVH